MSTATEFKNTIFGHAEFRLSRQSIISLFEKWKLANTPRSKIIAVGDHPKALIETLSEDLLETFRSAQLLDPYDVYQHLMDYWAETMQDDLYMLVRMVGRSGATTPLVEEKARSRKRSPISSSARRNLNGLDPTRWSSRYFAKEQAAIETLEADRDEIRPA